MIFDTFLLYWNRVIIGNRSTPFRNIIAIHCGYYYYDLINLTDFYTYYFILCFHDQSYFKHKNNKQHRRGTIWYNGSNQRRKEQFEGQENC